MQATKQQKHDIRKNAQYKVDIKEEWVQWATADKSKTSLNDLSYEQAEKIIRAQTGQDLKPVSADNENWAYFDKNNKRHKLILSLCRQAQWTIPHPTIGEVADLERLSAWLKSEKSPVRKKLTLMDAMEIEKIIKALNGIVKSIYK